MSIVDNTTDIGNRVREAELASGRAPEPLVDQVTARAAVRTLISLGYTYTPCAQMWKPPLGKPPEFASVSLDWTHELTELWDFPGFEP